MKPLPMSRAVLCLLAVLTVTTLLPSLDVLADEGRIPIYGPTTITQAGTYIVTRDFCFGQFAVPPCAAIGTGIDINANDVVVDLNGHTLSMLGSNAVGVRVTTSAATRGIVIRNGRIVGDGSPNSNGIVSSGTNPVRLSIEDVTVRLAMGDCISIASAEQVVVERNSLEGCANALSIIGSRFQGRIVDNNVLDAAGHGMDLLGLEGGQVLGNRVKKFAQTSNANGIWLSDGGKNLVQGNVITASGTTGANSNGILLDGAPTSSSNNVLRENTVTGVPYGIRAYSDENRLERNLVTGGSQTGVWIGNVGNGARTMVEDNQILSFTGCGLFFVNTLSHVYRNNVIRNNGGGSDVCGFAAPITNGGGNICTAACP
ncbi:MAG TPA: right-handed parallel beta-helix repeat-containing protein [Candidatus Polarisedimenticolia bacterium]|nr:right-handed parallel beta-helix repeat-containing protein [Candidatus Polarisedimenticolia bacterium]